MRRCTALLLIAGAAGAAQAQLPEDLAFQNFITSGLSQPVALRHAGDGSNRVFIVQKGGTILVAQLDASGNPTVLAEPFLSQAVTTSSESGLLGLAFHPNFPENGYFYIAFTAHSSEPRLGTTPDQVVARFSVSADNPNRADPTSRLDIIRIPDLAGNHNGGDVHFGPDGYLYYSSGDGGPQNDPHGFALCNWKKTANNTPNTCSPGTATNYWLLGKVIRLDVDQTSTGTAEMCGATAGQTANYSIPAGNPYVGSSETCDEIWHTGLRNPWRFSFDRATDEMYIGDVGQSAREEISLAPPGEALHFGWGCMEGFRVNKTSAPCVDDPVNSFPGSILPILDYPRGEGTAVSGGYVFRGPIARVQGVYWFGDSTTGNVWRTQRPGSGTVWPRTQFTTHSSVVGFGEDEAGNLYSVGLGGSIRKLTSEFIFDHGFD